MKLGHLLISNQAESADKQMNEMKQRNTWESWVHWRLTDSEHSEKYLKKNSSIFNKCSFYVSLMWFFYVHCVVGCVVFLSKNLGQNSTTSTTHGTKYCTCPACPAPTLSKMSKLKLVKVLSVIFLIFKQTCVIITHCYIALRTSMETTDLQNVAKM